jgi:hypothetical protein
MSCTVGSMTSNGTKDLHYRQKINISTKSVQSSIRKQCLLVTKVTSTWAYLMCTIIGSIGVGWTLQNVAVLRSVDAVRINLTYVVIYFIVCIVSTSWATHLTGWQDDGPWCPYGCSCARYVMVAATSMLWWTFLTLLLCILLSHWHSLEFFVVSFTLTHWNAWLIVLLCVLLASVTTSVYFEVQMHADLKFWHVVLRLVLLVGLLMIVNGLDCVIQNSKESNESSNESSAFVYQFGYDRVGFVFFSLFGFSADTVTTKKTRSGQSTCFNVRRVMLIGQGISLGFMIHGLFTYGNGKCRMLTS